MRFWPAALIVLLDAAVWLGLVWLGFAVYQYCGIFPNWSLPAFLIPATIQLWCRIGTTIGELLAVLFFLVGAGVFFFVAINLFGATNGLPDILAYAICAGASLAGFRTWQPIGVPPDNDRGTP